MTADPSVTEHQIRSAIHVARLVDTHGNRTRAVRWAYERAITEGEHPAAHLRAGEAVLLRAGLLVERDEELFPAPGLAALAALDDELAYEIIAVAAGVSRPLPTDDLTESEPRDATRDRSVADLLLLSALGAAGEEHVVDACRNQLRELERPDLAEGVQRVSLISDALGYDVTAPKIVGQPRALEVKTQLGAAANSVRFFLTRNEFEVGRRTPTWALVACTATEPTPAACTVVGWCRADALRPYLPLDHHGRWTEALVVLPSAVLSEGVPDPV